MATVTDPLVSESLDPDASGADAGRTLLELSSTKRGRPPINRQKERANGGVRVHRRS